MSGNTINRIDMLGDFEKTTIVAVGDIMMGEQPLCHGFGVKSKALIRGFNYLLNNVKYILESGDIVFGNLEAPLADVTYKKGIYADYFRASPESIHSLKNSGFNFLGVANNHIMDHGLNGFYHTIDYLKKNNIMPVGVRNKPQYFKKSDTIIGLFGCSLIDDFAKYHPYNKFSFAEEDVNELNRIIKVIREKANVVIVSVHWGCEYVPYPSPGQVELGRKLIDFGADIVLGSHPHVLQCYEIYKERPIFYSLGNFIFDHQYIKETRKTIIAKIKIESNFNRPKIDIVPIVCNSKIYSPCVADGKYKDEILSFLSTSRDLIEGRSVQEYSDCIGDYRWLLEKHKKIAKREMKIQFAKNILRYPWELKKDILKKQINALWKVHNESADHNGFSG